MRHEFTKRRDARAAQLRVRGWTYRDIADELGLASPGHAHDAVSRSISEAVRVPYEQMREIEAARLDELEREAWRVVEARHVMVSGGRPVKLDDEPVHDVRPVLDAMRVVLQVQERRARLLGLDAPRRSAVSVITQDVIEAEIERLEADIAARSEELDENRPEKEARTER